MNRILVLTIIAILTLLSCKTQDGLTNNINKEVENKEALPNIGKVIVDIQPDYTSEELAADFSEYEMEVVSITSKTLNAWAFRYNADLIKEPELLALLAANDYVIKANGISLTNATINKKENVLRKKTVIAGKQLGAKK